MYKGARCFGCLSFSFLLLVLLFLWGRMANFASEMLKNGFFTKKTLSFIIHFAKKGEYVGRRQ
jgi:hypothetical protein